MSNNTKQATNQATTQATQNEVNMMNIIKELNATISSLRVELDTLKLNSRPRLTPDDFQSKSYKESHDTESLTFISKKFNIGLNAFRQISDFMLDNGITDLKPVFKDKSGRAITIINDTLKFVGKETIKPYKPEKKV